jgi:hypothetical protein
MNQDLIEKFVAGRLGEAEADAFEEYCVANPEFAKQVEYEQRLKAGMAQVASGPNAEFVRSPNHHPLRWNIAAAAGILLSVCTLYFMWTQYVPTSVKPLMAAVTTDEQRNGASLRLALVRGNEAAPVLPPGITRVEIVGLFDLGFHYSVVLDRLEKNEKVAVATLYSQHPTSPVTIEVMVDGNRLPPGAYSLRVRRQSSDEESLDFGFVKP